MSLWSFICGSSFMHCYVIWRCSMDASCYRPSFLSPSEWIVAGGGPDLDTRVAGFRFWSRRGHHGGNNRGAATSKGRVPNNGEATRGTKFLFDPPPPQTKFQGSIFQQSKNQIFESVVCFSFHFWTKSLLQRCLFLVFEVFKLHIDTVLGIGYTCFWTKDFLVVGGLFGD